MFAAAMLPSSSEQNREGADGTRQEPDLTDLELMLASSLLQTLNVARQPRRSLAHALSARTPSESSALRRDR